MGIDFSEPLELWSDGSNVEFLIKFSTAILKGLIM